MSRVERERICKIWRYRDMSKWIYSPFYPACPPKLQRRREPVEGLLKGVPAGARDFKKYNPRSGGTIKQKQNK
ncbi:MAG: hypothetical protein A2946_02755 [Candidatus Liptonbacteria bacterium RIFCSPLOWO2_01_FULL_53_13]|uniref:Uncharacterized protein n=1 Tax=Candidatus Liptonbacteria bacterium RIFCSPLOWO2_01_FULL_53_13 TaxID=1798651 RepID=A0A1G2CMJ8_9BACT|nr:MAG: hypothetical protein A2946_02755 [Candidatus Liptonbacteria bacterium RIFCSPLOWO2_01_FULL_53_13]